MKRNDLTDRINYCNREIAWLREITPNCTRCENFRAPNECAKHGPIPDEYITVGCDDWTYDDVPF
jgi:hypothetical protein